MIKGSRLWLSILVLSLGARSYAQTARGCAILIDNSGSMSDYFNTVQLQDGKKLIMDLVFRGTYDQSIWDFHGQAGTLSRLWRPGELLYVHSFGDLDKNTPPYFRAAPQYQKISTEQTAQDFIQNQLFNSLTFTAPYTHDKLAGGLCWYLISRQAGQQGHNIYINKIILTDDISDPNTSYGGAGLEILNTYADNRVSETHDLLFTHRQASAKNNAVRLLAKVFKVGPHYIDPRTIKDATNVAPPPRPPVSTTSIRLMKPLPNQEFKKGQQTVTVAWQPQGEFEKFVVEISVVPFRKVFEQQVSKDRKTLSVNINNLLSRRTAKEKGNNTFVCKVIGKLGGANSEVRSNSVSIKIVNPVNAGRLMLLALAVILVATIGWLVGSDQGRKLIKKTRDYFKRSVPTPKDPKDPDW